MHNIMLVPMHAGASPTPGAMFGQGAGPIMSATCTGSEKNLSSCVLINNGHNYNHSNDAGVMCSSSTAQTVTDDLATNASTDGSTSDMASSIVVQTVTDELVTNASTDGSTSDTASSTKAPTGKEVVEVQLWGIVATTLLGIAVLIIVGVIIACVLLVCHYSRKTGMMKAQEESAWSK